MKTLVSILAAGGLALGPVASVQAQDGAAVFKPAGNWVADFGDDYCRLSRNFSNGPEQVSLAFERLRPGAQTGFVLVGNGIRTFRGADRLGYTLAPAHAEREARYVRSQTAEGKQYLNLGTITLTPFAPPVPGARPAAPPKYDRAAEQAVAKGVTAIALSKGLTSPVRIETGELGAPVKVLQECADDLVKSWGIDPQAAMALPQGPGLLPQGTIPFTDFAKLGGGANQIRVMVDAAGKPTKCQVHQPTLAQALNDKICGLVMSKGQFVQGKNAAGQAVASYWIGSPLLLGPPPRGRGPGGAGSGVPGGEG
ncbi:MAG: hypothetical protein ABIP41_01825 [Croceibacterium sp.]